MGVTMVAYAVHLMIPLTNTYNQTNNDIYSEAFQLMMS